VETSTGDGAGTCKEAGTGTCKEAGTIQLGIGVGVGTIATVNGDCEDMGVG